MPAGDLITVDFQVELQGLLTGAGTIYRLGPGLISGLGAPPTKPNDYNLQGQAGIVTGPEYAGPRILVVDYVIVTSTAVSAWNAVTTLATAWGPPGTDDVELHFQLPGWGHSKVTGRPRNYEPNVAGRRHLSGVIPGTAQFVASSPVITTGL